MRYVILFYTKKEIMDSLILDFIEASYTEELKQEFYKAIDLFNKFNYTNYETSLIDILMNQRNESSVDAIDAFTLEINNKLDYIISQHQLKVKLYTSIEDKTELLTGLYLLQEQEDYNSIISILESLEDDLEKFTTILSDVSSVNKLKLYEILDEFNPVILTKLKEFIYLKENNVVINYIDHDLRVNITLFFNYYKLNNIGYNLIHSDILIGDVFVTYIPFILSEIVGIDDKETALNILSVLNISNDGYKDPIGVYREHSMTLLNDLNKVSAIEVILINLSNNFMDFKKAQLTKV